MIYSCWYVGIATLRSHKLNTLAILPKALDGFVDKCGYHHLQIMKENDMLLAIQDDTDDDLDESIIEQASKLMEAIVLGGTFWFTLTHFDVFFQNHPGYDDCARPQRHEYSLKPQVSIITKEEFGNIHYQVVIRWANIELLGLAGYYGSTASTARYAFLGSSLPKRFVSMCIDDMKNASIYARNKQSDIIKHVRFLRDYTKDHASRLWSLESYRTATVGKFRACHPLMYGDHWTMQQIKYKSPGHLASLIFRVLCKKQYTQKDRQRALELIARTKDLQDSLIDSTTVPTTLSEVEILISDKVPSSTLLAPLHVLVELDGYLKTDQDNIDITTMIPQFKQLGLDIYKSCFARLLSNANEQTLKNITL